MKIVENLSALALRQLIDAASKTDSGSPAPNADLLRRQLAAEGERLRLVLARSADYSWRALEIVLAGRAWWEQGRRRLRGGEEEIAAAVQAALDSEFPGELPELDALQRRQCLRELHAARRGGLLGGELDRSEDFPWLERAAASDRQLVDGVAEELRQAFPTLSEFLTLRPPGGSVPLARAVRLFLRQAVAADPELAQAPPFATLPPLTAAEKALADALTGLFTRHADRLDGLLVLASGPADGWDLALDVEAETRSAAEPLPLLGRVVLHGLRRHQLQGRPLHPVDFVAVAEDDEQRRIKELAGQVHALDEEQQRRFPALLHGLALLEAAASSPDEAQNDLLTAVAKVGDPQVRACVCSNAFRVALEQHNWQAALALQQQAVTLNAEAHALFPPDKYEAERVIGSEPTGVTFLCKHRASGERVLVRTLWPDALARDVPDLFRELHVLQELDHPLLPPLRDAAFADEARQRPYLVTDAVEGSTLSDYLRQHGPLTPAELLSIARPLAEVLQAAHERGVLHRYIKPGSVLLRKEGGAWRVKLINFGMAPRPDLLFRGLAGPGAWARTTLGGGALIALSYLGPEQLGLMDGAATGPAADVYSFGRLCYFALLGTAEPDDEEKDSLPLPWRKLLGQCTARNPARRPDGFRVVLGRLGQLAGKAETRPAAAARPAREAKPAGAPPRPGTEVLQALISRGMALKQQGQLDQAAAAFTKALQLDPKLLAGHIKRGNVFFDKGDYARAIADYTAALRIDPENAQAYMNRGLAHTKKGDFEAAVADCTEAVQRDVKLAVAYSIRAAAQWERGERHRAIADYNLALRYDPKNALAYNGRGLAFAEQAEYDRAIADYSQAVRNEPRLVVAYVNRGDAFRLKKNFDKAIADYTQALSIDRGNVLAHYHRALAHLALQAHDDALADLNRVLHLDPRHAEAAAQREEILRARGRTAAAAPAPAARLPAAVGQRSAPKGRPAAPPKRRPAEAPAAAAGAARPAANADQQAEEERRQMRAAAYFASGRSAYDQDSFRPAVEQFTRALQVDPTDPLIFYHRGLAHIALDNFGAALADFTESIRLNAKNALAHYQRGIAHRLLGKHDQAIEDYTQALKLDPRLALAYRNRSLAYAAKGDQERAKADYERALRLDPTLAREE